MNENHFLKIITIECLCFFVLACVGLAVYPKLQAKEPLLGEEKNSTWQSYSEEKEKLLEQLQKEKVDANAEEEDYQEKLLSGEENLFGIGKLSVEKVNLSKKNTEGSQITPKKLGESYIQIKKKNKEKLRVSLEHDYQQRKILVVLYGEFFENIKSEDIQLVWKNELYDVENMKKTKVFLHEMDCLGQKQGLGILNSILLEFHEESIFSYALYQDEQYVYIKIARPKDVYEKVVVIDAGHGGEDTGTYAKYGDWDEKDFNLDFTKKIEENWKNEKIKLYFTRPEDKQISLDSRVTMANDLQADIFLSVHCNSTDQGIGNGIEVLYKSNSYKNESKKIAESFLKALSEETDLEKRGLINGNSIYIIRNSKMPTVLVEMGFLSDKGDLEYLRDEKNRDKMAKIMNRVVLDWLE